MSSCNRPSRFVSIVVVRILTPVIFPPGRIARDEPKLHGITTNRENNRYHRCRRLCSEGGDFAASRYQHFDWLISEFCRQRWQPIVLTARKAVFNGHRLTFDKGAFCETTAERGQQVRRVLGRPAAEVPNHRHCLLLRTRNKRPSRRAANKCNEIASSHRLPQGLGPRHSHRRLQQGFATGEMGSGVKLHRSNPELPMSALGQKRTLTSARTM